MRSLLPLQLAVATTLGAAIWVNTNSVSPLPDWQQGELVVIVPPLTMETENAFETALLQLFARQLQVKLKTVPTPIATALPDLAALRAHLATGIRPTTDYPMRFSTPYQTLDELLVCTASTPKKLSALAGRELVVAAGSAQEAALRVVRREHELLEWESRRDTTPIELIEQVADGALDCTVVNEEQYANARNLYPFLDRGLNLGAPSAMGWAFAGEADTELFDAAQAFFARIKQDGTLRRLIDRHYGFNERLNAVNAEAFISQSRSLLPNYRHLFQEAADLTGIDWKLLAALGYQESHWNPNATSYTNVRGMMMLTEKTADRMKVQNRLDARESILAGSRYLQLLKEQLPLRIHEDDRLWMALAAYNVGMGHLEDARILTSQAGLNPDLWGDVKRMLPLLTQTEISARTKFGKARGGEAVILVETVRLYYDMLKRLEAQNTLKETPTSNRGGLLEKFLGQ